MTGSKHKFKTFTQADGSTLVYLVNGEQQGSQNFRQVNITKNPYYGYDVVVTSGFKDLAFRLENSLAKAKKEALTIINKY